VCLSTIRTCILWKRRSSSPCVEFSLVHLVLFPGGWSHPPPLSAFNFLAQFCTRDARACNSYSSSLPHPSPVSNYYAGHCKVRTHTLALPLPLPLPTYTRKTDGHTSS
jgi:hypothetical protein